MQRFEREAMIGLDFCFPHQFLPAIVLVSLLSVGVLISLFAYLNCYTKRRYFSIWTTAWLFYALALVLWLRELEYGYWPPLFILRHWCVGASGVFLFWGSSQFLNLSSRQTLIGLFLVFLLVWDYVVTIQFGPTIYLQSPIFSLIGLASMLTAACFWRQRVRQGFLGGSLLANGFMLWGVYLVAYPFMQRSEYLVNAAVLISTVLQLFIAISMIVLVLEEVRATRELALQQAQEEKARNQALRAQAEGSENRYRTLVENSLDGIVILDFTGKILLANRAAIEMFELAPDQVVGRNALDFIAPESKETLWRDLQKVKAGLGGSPKTFQGITAKARRIWIETLSCRTQFDEQPADLVAFRDITQRRHMEERLRHMQTMEAITQLAGGIAHDFNNALTVILGHVRILLTTASLSPETVNSLKQIGSSGERAANLTRQLLTYSRRQILRRQILNLNAVIQQLSARLEQMASPNATLLLQLDPALPDFQADAWMMETIIMNLAKNAREAMPTGGQLLIATSHVRVDERTAQTNLEARSGAALCLRVQDTGRGMDEETRRRIFEPFFTTKEFGKGTGLGLPLVYGITKQHEGWITVDSAVGKGSTFCVFFPLEVAPEPAAAPPEGLPAARSA